MTDLIDEIKAKYDAMTPAERVMAAGGNTVEHALLAMSDRWAMRDREFGTSLATQVRQRRSLTVRQLYAAHRMLGAYVHELADRGITYSAIPQPAPPPPKITSRILDVSEPLEAFLLQSEFNPEIAAAVKALPDHPRIWKPDLRAWAIAWSEDNIVGLAAIVRRFDFNTTPAATELLARADALAEAQAAYAEEMIRQSIAAASTFEVPGLGPGCELRPFQRAGVKYAITQKRTFIADEPGLGKTVQGLAVLQSLGTFPAIVVCPASVKAVWKDHVRRWLPHKRAHVISGNAKYEDAEQNMLFAIGLSGDVLIVNYDILHSWTPTLLALAPQAVIFDESHYLKTSSTRRAQAAKKLAEKLAKDAGVVLLLTGTPALNRPAELPSQLNIMGRLHEFAESQAEFLRFYSGTRKNAHGELEGEDRGSEERLREINTKMRTLCYIRRTKAQVLTELPPKQRSVIPIELDNRAEYLAAESDTIRHLLEVDPAKARHERIAEDLASIEKLKQLAAKGMMAGILEWCEDFLEGEEKLVMFGWHRAIVGQFAEHFACDSITGDTPLLRRDQYVQAFQSKPEKRVIVGNIQAMGVGLTLTASSTVGFMELGWNGATHDQAEDRVHRIGQEDSVNAYYFVGVGTIYERILRLIDAKRLVVGAITDGIMSTANQSILSDLIADLTGGRRRPREEQEVPA